MIDLIRKGIEIIVTNYFGAIFIILLGIGLIFFTIKYPQKDPASPLQGDIKGWVGGVCSILLGISIIILKFLGKL